MTTIGCPECGSNRLKGAPVPLVSVLIGAVTRRRRYKCADCQWTGWKHRLRRRSDSLAVGLQPRELPEARAWWFFGLMVGLLGLAAVLLAQNCEPRTEEDSAVGASHLEVVSPS
jgi:hypothetical protein